MAVNINHTHPSCAACRYQRKKCSSNCLLRRHFPASNTEGFAAVHRVFGVANVIKMMREANSLADQDELARSLYWEAAAWARDPVRGPYGAFALLQDEIRGLREQLNRHRMLLMQNPPLHVNNNITSSNDFHGNMGVSHNTSNNNVHGNMAVGSENYYIPFHGNMGVGSENYYIPQQMPRSMIKEDYDVGPRVSVNGTVGPESNIRVTANNLSWQQHCRSPQHHDYKMR